MMEEEEKKVVVKLQKQLLESERRERRQRRIGYVILTFVFLFLFLIGFLGGYLFHRNFAPHQGSSSGVLDELKFYMENVWLYKDDYEDLDGLLDDKAFYGMTFFSEDPYTGYMSASELEAFAESINKNYVGIGVQYTDHDGIMTITRVFKDSPAEKAGVLVGDIIWKVNGESMEGTNTEEVKERVSGESGTPVDITFLRGGEEVTLTIIRAEINSTVYAYAEEDYVVLEIMSFGESTADEIVRYLEPYRNYERLIIDLRDNGGGYQTSVQEVAGLFLGEDVTVMDQINNTGKTVTYKTIVYGDWFDNFKKIVVLTNGNTASAAEVLTICLKEMHPDTTQVGESTYGKGVVQSTYMIDGGNASLKITTSKWLSPKGVWVNEEGIHPDVEVYLDDIQYLYYRDLPEGGFEVDEVGEQVMTAQMALSFLDYEIDRTDGYFSKGTEAVLRRYQSDKGLEINGKLDEDTYYALIGEVLYEGANNPLKDTQMIKAIEIVTQ